MTPNRMRRPRKALTRNIPDTCIVHPINTTLQSGFTGYTTLQNVVQNVLPLQGFEVQFTKILAFSRSLICNTTDYQMFYLTFGENFDEIRFKDRILNQSILNDD